jgi:hypothetical protein
MDALKFRLELLLDLYNQAKVAGSLRTWFSPEFLEKYHLDNDSTDPEVDKLLIFSLEYLENKGYVEVSWATRHKVCGLHITAYGCDVAEFAQYGKSFDGDDSRNGFQFMMNQIAKSGMNVLESSTVGFVNIALQNLLK